MSTRIWQLSGVKLFQIICNLCRSLSIVFAGRYFFSISFHNVWIGERSGLLGVQWRSGISFDAKKSLLSLQHLADKLHRCQLIALRHWMAEVGFVWCQRWQSIRQMYSSLTFCSSYFWQNYSDVFIDIFTLLSHNNPNSSHN